MEAEGAGKGKSDPSIEQVKLGVLLGILSQATQSMDDCEMHHKLSRESSASSHRFCFRSPAQRRSRPTDSSQVHDEHLQF